MALLAIKNAPLSKTNKMLAQETLQDLSNNASYEKFMDLVAMTERNRYWVENIEIAMSNFPLETEIVIFAGCLHMPGLVKGRVQRNKPTYQSLILHLLSRILSTLLEKTCYS